MSDNSASQLLGPEVASFAAPWPEKVTLKGKFVTLEALSQEHTEELFKHLAGKENEHLFTYIPDPPVYDLKSFEEAIDAKANNKEWLFFAIIDPATRLAMGYVCLMNINLRMRSVEVGNVMFSSKMQRSPAGTECIYLLARYLFDELAYRRFEWKANHLNKKSRQAAERLGFTFEGIFRKHMIIKGRSRDSAYYSMLDDEWPIVKQSFEKWLAGDNFDEWGKQKSTLQALRKELTESGS